MTQNYRQAIKQKLASDDVETRWWAVREIKEGGYVDLLPALFEALQDPSPRIRLSAAGAIGTLGISSSIEHLSASLASDSDPKVRSACAVALREAGDSGLQDALGTAIYDYDEQVVISAIHSLVETHSVSPVHQLAALLGHESWKVRLNCCQALVKLRYVTPLVVDAINQLRQDPLAAEYDAQIAEFWESNSEKFDGIKNDAGVFDLGELEEAATEIYASNTKVQLRFEM